MNNRLTNILREAISHLNLTPLEKACVLENIYSVIRSELKQHDRQDKTVKQFWDDHMSHAAAEVDIQRN